MQPATQEPWGAPASGEAGVLPAPASSPGKKGARGGLRGSLPGIAASFLTPNQPGSLARHLGASSRAAKACDSPRSRGGFGWLPRWRARLSVAEPLRALPAPAGVGSESRDKRACVRLPAAGPAERPPAQLNRARFPCGRSTRRALWPPPTTHRPWGTPTLWGLPWLPAGAGASAALARHRYGPLVPKRGHLQQLLLGMAHPIPKHLLFLPLFSHPGAHSTRQRRQRGAEHPSPLPPRAASG